MNVQTAPLDSVRHPSVARVADVLRARTANPRTILIEDEENIAQAIRLGVRIHTLYGTPEHREGAERLRDSAPEAAVRVISRGAAQQLFRAAAHEKHSRLFALARAPKAASWQRVLNGDGDILVLDGVRIAGNIGAMIRSAYALGAAGVVLLDSGLSTVFDRRVIRASRGLVFGIPVILAAPTDLVRRLEEHGIGLAALTADADAPLSSIGAASDRFALLLGGERRGASQELEALARERFSIGMAPGTESLNVSVAAALALYERGRGGGSRSRIPDPIETGTVRPS